MTHRALTGINPDFSSALFGDFDGFGDNSNLILVMMAGLIFFSSVVSLSG